MLFTCSANSTSAPSNIRTHRPYVGHNSSPKRDVTL
ncbi:hypothetical protein M3J09_002872 [Ascochyta lentis]